jgi:hypothetical protein
MGVAQLPLVMMLNLYTQPVWFVHKKIKVFLSAAFDIVAPAT